MCSVVVQSRQFKQMLEMCVDDSLNSSTPLVFLNYSQIQEKFRQLKGSLNSEKLHNLNLVRNDIVAKKRSTH